MPIPKLQDHRYTNQATENFLHAVRVILMEQPVIHGEPVTTIKDVCTAIGMQNTSVPMMKAGTRAVTLEQVANMCKVFGFNLEWMVYGTGPMKGKDSATTRMDDLERKLRDLEAVMVEMKPIKRAR